MFRLRCPRCGSWLKDEGIRIYCPKCGLVYWEKFQVVTR